jgi:DegV family protein with EDD domain
MRLDAAMVQLGHLRTDTKLLVGLDSLDNLAKGGRIGKVSAFLGSMLNLKVTLTVDPDGAFQPVARSRGDRAAFDHTLDWVAKTMGEHKRGAFAIGYALNRERAEHIATAMRERYDVSDLFIYDAGSVICAHTGTGWGVAVVPGGLPGSA